MRHRSDGYLRSSASRSQPPPPPGHATLHRTSGSGPSAGLATLAWLRPVPATRRRRRRRTDLGLQPSLSPATWRLLDGGPSRLVTTGTPVGWRRMGPRRPTLAADRHARSYSARAHLSLARRHSGVDCCTPSALGPRRARSARATARSVLLRSQAHAPRTRAKASASRPLAGLARLAHARAPSRPLCAPLASASSATIRICRC